MSIKDSIYEHLKDNAGVAALVGTRIFHSVAPKGSTRPYIIFQKTSGDHIHHFTAAAGLARSDYQITFYDLKPKDAEAGAEAIRNAMDGFIGTMGTVVTTTVQYSFLGGEIDLFEPADETQHSKSLYAVNQDWEFWHVETVPSL